MVWSKQVDSSPSRGGFFADRGRRIRLYLKVDTRDVVAAVLRTETRALAEFCKSHVRTPAQLKSRRNQNAVDVDANPAFKLKQHANGS